MKVVTKKDLDASGCGVPDCGHDHSVLYLHPRCHLRAGTRVRYEKATGLLVVECVRCGREVTRIALGD
jgi:hypothetical protein